MPGVDVEAAKMVNESPILGSVKVHKATSRKESSKGDSSQMPQAGRRRSPPAPLKARDRTSYPTSERLRSWMRESSEIHALPIIGQPLTPPINFRDNFKSWIDDKALRDREFLSQQKISPGNTPLVANSPPTPETTPPRHMYKFSAAESQPASRNISNASVGTVRYVPESSTDSFRTARENASSDDENRLPDSPSLHPSRQKWLRNLGLSNQKDVGLGLGLESEDDDEPPTPKGVNPVKKRGKKEEDFVTFDGAWGSNEPDEMKIKEDGATMRLELDGADQRVIKKIAKGAYLDSPTLGTEVRPSSKKHAKVKRKAKEHKKVKTMDGRQKDEERAQSPWPLKDNVRSEANAYTESEDVDVRRLSTASTTSTRVEAMVIDSPPQRRQTLRHTGKMMRLDALHQQQDYSNRSSLQSDDHALKHQLRSARYPDALRQRFASETSKAGAQKSALASLEGSAVVVLPDRRSSLQSSSEGSKRMSRTFSLSSKQQSSRPTTAPDEAVGYFDVPRRERRTVSVVIQQATPLKLDNATEKDDSPPINDEASAPTAAASRELSRTTSATSGGLATHYIPQSPTSQRSITPQTMDAQDGQIVHVNRSSSGDWGALRPGSALVTPLSLRSAHSSTPGMLEVNEATAISIYPHTNKSILVIQEMAGRDDSRPREQSAVIAENASIALPGAFAPVVTQHAPPSPQREIADSPLQNPREPPQPPDFKIIPPTPANAASSSEDTVRNVGSRQRSNRFSAPLTSLRRALSARRYSESMSNPFVFTRTLSLRDMAGRQRPHAAEDSKESQLHPFWRPRSFWDDMNGSDSESEFGNNGTLSPQRPSSHGTAYRSNSTPKRSQSLTSRITNSLRSPSTHRPMIRRASVSLTSDIVPRHTMNDLADVETKPAKPRRTLSLTNANRNFSLTRKIGGSLRLPSKGTTLHRRPQRSTTADWHDQPPYEFVRPEDRLYTISANAATNPTHPHASPQEPHYHHNQQQHQHQQYTTPPPFRPNTLRNLAERIERRRSVREEGRREERRNWLKGRIGFVGVKDSDDVLEGFDIVYPPPRPPPVAPLNSSRVHSDKEVQRHGSGQRVVRGYHDVPAPGDDDDDDDENGDEHYFISGQR